MGGTKTDDEDRALTVRSGAIAVGFLLSVPGAIGGALALAPLWAVIGVIAAPWRALPRLIRKGGLALALFLAFFVWAQISMLWAPHYDVDVASHMAGGVLTGLLLIAAFAWKRERRDSQLVRLSAIIFAFAALALGAIEIFGNAPITRIFQPDARLDLLMRGPMKGVTVLAATSWAIAAMIWRHGVLARSAVALLGAGVLVLALNSNMDANVVSVVCGALGFFAGLFYGGRALRVVALFMAIFILFAPWIFSFVVPVLHQIPLPPSWSMRVDIWDASLKQIAAHPLFGSGFGSFRDVALSFDYAGTKITAQHTHNAPLQIWFETGLVGATLAACALATLAWPAADAQIDDPIGAAATTATIAAVLPASLLSWAIWQEWWVATLFLAGGIAAAAARPPKPRTRPNYPAAVSETGSSTPEPG